MTKEYEPEEGSTYYCKSHPRTKAFMDDLVAVFKKHKMIVMPTFSGGGGHEISMHDDLQVVPLKNDFLKFVTESGFDPKDFGITKIYI